MFGLITKREHDEIVAAKDAEIALRQKCALPEIGLRVLDEMSYGYGYSASNIAANVGISEKQARAIMRAFEALGWAELHPFFSEDDNLVRGSGYSLRIAGADAQQALRDLPTRPVGEMVEGGL